MIGKNTTRVVTGYSVNSTSGSYTTVVETATRMLTTWPDRDLKKDGRNKIAK